MRTMSRWRPRPSIRVLAIGIVWRQGKLLLAEVADDSGRIKGLRPLGGGVDFGESWRTALRREFREELGLDVTITGTPTVFENLYTHEGHPGHEIVFAARSRCPKARSPGTRRSKSPKTMASSSRLGGRIRPHWTCPVDRRFTPTGSRRG